MGKHPPRPSCRPPRHPPPFWAEFQCAPSPGPGSEAPGLRAGRAGVNSGGTGWAPSTCRCRRRGWEGRGKREPPGRRERSSLAGAARRARRDGARGGPSGLGNSHPGRARARGPAHLESQRRGGACAERQRRLVAQLGALGGARGAPAGTRSTGGEGGPAARSWIGAGGGGCTSGPEGAGSVLGGSAGPGAAGVWSMGQRA